MTGLFIISTKSCPLQHGSLCPRSESVYGTDASDMVLMHAYMDERGLENFNGSVQGHYVYAMELPFCFMTMIMYMMCVGFDVCIRRVFSLYTDRHLFMTQYNETNNATSKV